MAHEAHIAHFSGESPMTWLRTRYLELLVLITLLALLAAAQVVQA